MRIGMIGLGRMGANMVRRLQRDDHELVVYDVDEEAVREIESEGAEGTTSLEDLVAALDPPRVVWLMIPAGFVGQTVDRLADLLDERDIIVDGGNSYYRDDIDRAQQLEPTGIRYVDVGVSGGVWGLERGYSLMIGGDDDAVDHLDPVFRSLAPGVEAAPRTEGRQDEPAPVEHGYLHCGPTGAGHFVKMVHNGIEYGVMAAYAEGLAILERADVGAGDQQHDAETAPMAHPEYYRFDIDVAAVTEVWRRGSVIQSWLLDLTAAALLEDPELDGFDGRVSDSGEGRWTVLAAVDEGVPAHVIAAALFERFASRGNADFAGKTLSAMRKQFGGHEEKAEG
ncbi:MAG: decarboxylating 6-phosphogluconate dehydrogenase [Actinobacteria bacterium]|nr:decarboxylating 6-phosphogluconate dehydrogenase [Actinomycetota bacterium]